MRFKAITRAVLATSLLGTVLSGVGATAPAWGDHPDGDLPPHAHLSVTPSRGPAETAVELQGSGYTPDEKVTISFNDANGSRELFWIWADSIGSFTTGACVPRDATLGAASFSAQSPDDGPVGLAPFYVTRRGVGSPPPGICISS